MAVNPADGIERIKFKGDERVQFGRDVLGKVNAARTGMRELLKRLDKWMEFYESDLPPKDFPWEGCSNVNIPLIQSHVDTWHAAMNDIMLTPRPWMTVNAPANVNVPNIKDGALAVQDALYQVQDELCGLRAVCDRWNLNSLVQQAGIVKYRWVEEFRTVKRRQPVVDEAGLPVVDKRGQPVVKAQTVQEPKFKGPKAEIVDLHNFVIFPLTAESIEDAQIVGDRFRLTADQIRRKVKDGLWDKAEAESCLARMSSDASFSDPAGPDDSQDDREGVERMADAEYVWFWELIAPYDADGDGLAEDCVFVIEADTGTVVRATTYPYWHGRRYYIAQRPFPRPRQRFFGRCLPQILEHMQREMNAVHNQRADATTISISPPFLRLRTSDVDADHVKFYPGAEILVDSMDEIQQLKVRPLIPGIELEQQAKDWSERASPINDLAMGRQTEGTKKTLGEVQIVTAKSGQRVADVVSRLQEEGMTELAQQTLGLMYQFMSDEELDFYNVTRELLTIPWNLVPYGNISTADKQMKRQEADFMYMLLTGGQGGPPNPLVVNDPMRLYRLTQDLLQAHERKDVENYIGTEEELRAQMEQAQAMQAQQQQMMQQQMMAQEMAAQGGFGPGNAGTVGTAGGPVAPGMR